VKELEGVAALGVFLLLVMFEIIQRFKSYRGKLVFASLFMVTFGLAALVLWNFGIISLPFGKFMSVINPLKG